MQLVSLYILAGIATFIFAESAAARTMARAMERDQLVFPDESARVCDQNHPNAKYIRLRFVPRQELAIVSVRDQAGRTYDYMVDPEIGSVWTTQLLGRCAVVSTTSIVRIDRILVDNPEAELKSFFPPGEPPSYHSPSIFTQPLVTSSVANTALIYVVRDEAELTCTAVALSSTLLLTNYHCVKSRAEARSVAVATGTASPTDARGGDWGADLLFPFPDLDLSLLSLSTPLDVPPLSATWKLDRPREGAPLLVIHHLAAQGVLVSTDSECRVVAENLVGAGNYETDFGHHCDTEKGSSGSLILSGDASCPTIVGIHHWGVAEDSDLRTNQAVMANHVMAAFGGTEVSDALQSHGYEIQTMKCGDSE